MLMVCFRVLIIVLWRRIVANPLVKKDFCKLDVYRFDVDHLVDDLYDITISNSISWDMMSLKVTRGELVGLADFINRIVNTNDQA